MISTDWKKNQRIGAQAAWPRRDLFIQCNISTRGKMKTTCCEFPCCHLHRCRFQEINAIWNCLLWTFPRSWSQKINNSLDVTCGYWKYYGAIKLSIDSMLWWNEWLPWESWLLRLNCLISGFLINARFLINLRSWQFVDFIELVFTFSLQLNEKTWHMCRIMFWNNSIPRWQVWWKYFGFLISFFFLFEGFTVKIDYRFMRKNSYGNVDSVCCDCKFVWVILCFLY